MIIHHYDPETGRYIGSTVAEADPMELALAREAVATPLLAAIEEAHPLEIEGDDAPADRAARHAKRAAAIAAAHDEVDAVRPTHWLIPAHATTAEPAPNDGEEIVMTADGWVGRPCVAPPESPPIVPEPTPEAAARSRRDLALVSLRWMVDRHRDQVDLGMTPTLTPTRYLALLTFIQGLRDVPTQPDFPATIDWPHRPSFIPASILFTN